MDSTGAVIAASTVKEVTLTDAAGFVALVEPVLPAALSNRPRARWRLGRLGQEFERARGVAPKVLLPKAPRRDTPKPPPVWRMIQTHLPAANRARFGSPNLVHPIAKCLAVEELKVALVRLFLGGLGEVGQSHEDSVSPRQSGYG